MRRKNLASLLVMMESSGEHTGSCDVIACMMNDDRMSYDDFKRNFTDIEICNITLDQFDVDQSGESLQ